MNLAVLIIY